MHACRYRCVFGSILTMWSCRKQHGCAGSEISSEPSYILFNTAVSSEWGFPKECPANCPCKTYDCNSKDFREICGFSEGFCDMMKDSPPQMKVNWIRVYQNPDDPLQKVGCSTPERPTRRYIEAHEKLYKQEHDVRVFLHTGWSHVCRPILTLPRLDLCCSYNH
jgi:hypothetical protein